MVYKLNEFISVRVRNETIGNNSLKSEREDLVVTRILCAILNESKMEQKMAIQHLNGRRCVRFCFRGNVNVIKLSQICANVITNKTSFVPLFIQLIDDKECN